jgi:hypothetical protein
MRISVFKGRGNWYGFTATDDGSDLPPDHGPWTAWKLLDMKPGQVPRWGITVDEVFDALQDGHPLVKEVRVVVKIKEDGK